MAEKTEAERKDQLKRGESAASLKERRMLLEAKQQVIEEVIQKAKESLYSLSDEEYFEAIVKMANKYSTGEKGQLLLNEADKKRMPGDFGKKIESAALTLSNETRSIDGGFVYWS
jgi:V/A-type H+-transporting ATPase subunit E